MASELKMLARVIAARRAVLRASLAVLDGDMAGLSAEELFHRGRALDNACGRLVRVKEEADQTESDQVVHVSDGDQGAGGDKA